MVEFATIIFLILLFIGIPFLILYLKDHGGLTGIIVKKIFGGISLLFGVAILAWVLYNKFFGKTAEFKSNTTLLPVFAVPLALIWFGWYWLTDKGQPAEKAENENSE